MGCGFRADLILDDLGAVDRSHHLFLYAAYLIVGKPPRGTINLVLLLHGPRLPLKFAFSGAAAPYLLSDLSEQILPKEDLPFLCLSLVLALSVGIYVKYSEAAGKTFSN